MVLLLSGVVLVLKPIERFDSHPFSSALLSSESACTCFPVSCMKRWSMQVASQFYRSCSIVSA